MQIRKPERDSSYKSLETDPSEAYVGLSEHSRQPYTETQKPEDKLSLFWRVFGGTILSIIALIGVTLYNTLNNSISELRAEVIKLNEARSELLKKDDYNARMTVFSERLHTLQGSNTTQTANITAVNTEIAGLKDRLTKVSTDTDSIRKELTAALEANRKDMAAASDAIKKDIVTLDLLKEKTNLLGESVKVAQDETKKLRQEVDKNQAADNERKAQRDAQYVKIDEALKEMNKTLQICREKIARIEGATGPSTLETKK